MNKTSRKSGGNAWRKPPDKLAQTIGLVNALAEAINSPAIKLPKRPIGIYELDSGQRAVAVAPEMRRLEIFLSKVSRELAKDILEYSPYYRDRDIDNIINNLGSNNQLFSPEMMESGVNDFNQCMFRLESLQSFYYLLRALISRWEYESRQFEEFMRRSGDNELYPYQVRSAEWTDFELIKIDSERTINLMYSDPLILLHKVEIDRLRICPRCDQIFWGGRKNMAGCSKCSHALSNKKWNDKISPKQKQKYNEARRNKRKNKNDHLETTDELSESILMESDESFEENAFGENVRVSRIGTIDIKDGKEMIVIEERENFIITKPIEKEEETTVKKIWKKIFKK
jgi:predicted  nucleic acid-binding Zn-ribbon protein